MHQPHFPCRDQAASGNTEAGLRVKRSPVLKHSDAGIAEGQQAGAACPTIDMLVTDGMLGRIATNRGLIASLAQLVLVVLALTVASTQAQIPCDAGVRDTAVAAASRTKPFLYIGSSRGDLSWGFTRAVEGHSLPDKVKGNDNGGGGPFLVPLLPQHLLSGHQRQIFELFATRKMPFRNAEHYQARAPPILI